MNEVNADQVLSMPQYLLRIGFEHQLIVISTGVVLILLATVALFFARNRTLISGISFLTLIPGIVASVSITGDLERFLDFATAQTPPKPSEFADVTGSIAAAGFWGILMTIIPAGLCLAALLKAPSYIDEPPMD